MPIIKAAVKALRQSEKRRVVNRIKKDRLKNNMKEMIKLGQQKKMEEFKKRLPDVMSIIDKAAKDNLIHRNTAARKKSRLSRLMAAK